MKKAAAITLFGFFCFLSMVWAREEGMLGGGFTRMPAPARLISPLSDKVDLSGKDVLEFKWWDGPDAIDHTEFRLFKGYQMRAGDLIEKRTLTARITSVKIKAKIFQDGEAYSWSVIRVAFGGEKSDKSVSSFKVTKK